MQHLELIAAGAAGIAATTAIVVAAYQALKRRRRDRDRDVERWLGIERYSTGCPHGVTGDHLEREAIAARRLYAERPGYPTPDLEVLHA